MIGIDICEVSRFDRLGSDDHFVQRVFTPAEIAYCRAARNSSQRFAARFAAKEAVAKALGTGFGKNVSCLETEVTKTETGQPIIKLHGKTKDFFDSNFPGKTIHLSLSHEKSVAVAVAVIL